MMPTASGDRTPREFADEPLHRFVTAGEAVIRETRSCQIAMALRPRSNAWSIISR